MHFAYLDEFGHVGPFISRTDSRHKASPVFGLAGFIMPADNVRHFGTWFYKRKCELLKWELARSGQRPWVWEKKGSSLYTVRNVEKYHQLRHFTKRFLQTIRIYGGSVFYFGRQKTEPPGVHDPTALYESVLRESLKRIDHFCEEDFASPENFALLMDEHSKRAGLLTRAATSMYGAPDQRKRLIEQPSQLESERYQTLQAADWIAALVGRLGAFWAIPQEYRDYAVFRRFFLDELKKVTNKRSVVWTGRLARGPLLNT